MDLIAENEYLRPTVQPQGRHALSSPKSMLMLSRGYSKGKEGKMPPNCHRVSKYTANLVEKANYLACSGTHRNLVEVANDISYKTANA